MDQIESRNNNFGFLRLMLASLVIVSHSPQILDGNVSREILKRFFGTLSLGDAAVDGFFLISGYLVTKSFLRSDSITSYVEKRVLRIVPGFVVSFWICVLLVGPLVGASGPGFLTNILLQQLANCFTLQGPISMGVFPGMHFRDLNNSMWTISFEFDCYIATMCLGMVGLFSRRLRTCTLIGVLVLLLGNAFDPALRGSPLSSVIRFGAVFGTGAMFYLFRDKVRLTNGGALLSGVLLFNLVFSRHWAETAIAIFGGYLIFWIAFKLPVLGFSKASNKVDVSYGVYLYAWPIASVIAWNFRTINPWLLTATTFLGSLLVGYLSWTLVEKPALSLITKPSPARVSQVVKAGNQAVPLEVSTGGEQFGSAQVNSAAAWNFLSARRGVDITCFADDSGAIPDC
jgi:peptidoglycan/LPS O-acetylase OafA/YrhL